MSFNWFIVLLCFGIFLMGVGIITFIVTYKSAESVNGFLIANGLLKFIYKSSPEGSYIREKFIPTLDSLLKDTFKIFVLIFELFFALAGLFIVFITVNSYFHLFMFK